MRYYVCVGTFSRSENKRVQRRFLSVSFRVCLFFARRFPVRKNKVLRYAMRRRNAWELIVIDIAGSFVSDYPVFFFRFWSIVFRDDFSTSAPTFRVAISTYCSSNIAQNVHFSLCCFREIFGCRTFNFSLTFHCLHCRMMISNKIKCFYYRCDFVILFLIT